MAVAIVNSLKAEIVFISQFRTRILRITGIFLSVLIIVISDAQHRCIQLMIKTSICYFISGKY